MRDVLCPFHNIPMQAQPQKKATRKFFNKPLHRCPVCTEEWRAKLEHAIDSRPRRNRDLWSCLRAGQ